MHCIMLRSTWHIAYLVHEVVMSVQLNSLCNTDVVPTATLTGLKAGFANVLVASFTVLH